ncbi:MAG: metallophosphoesterase [Sporocytophaga sp.]|uniref:metallophosphoesterase n=1 Tax=Sporocytophaga sp. TaxID=2231183 RepID=UPI001AFCE4F5|nr:metallophosphoesterase [Sporocytophaga sp.]MBO9699568.1 metallophosphoesterase [Sporocytophaga sp.]
MNFRKKRSTVAFFNLMLIVLFSAVNIAGYANVTERNKNEIDIANEDKTSLVRGPYLQKPTPTSMILRWRTNNKVNSIVKYGLSPTDLTQSTIDLFETTEHTVLLSDLKPYTKYYYSIGFGDSILQGNDQNYFLTPPVKDSQGKYSFWVIGDCGNNSINQIKVRDQFFRYRGSNLTNGMLLLGDNAYWSGSDDEYKTGFFSIYERDALKNIPLYPAPGNHDYAMNSERQADHKIAYYDIFDTPSNGEAGGVPSGTEAFYSFDYGNIHFLSLDSYGKEDNATRLYDTLGAQVEWVKRDLEANKSKWIVAFWHHAPYTMGHHNSDTETELALIRSNFIRILERYGVDLIICGHSHSYERSKLIKGHYGAESTFDPDVHNLSHSSGRYDGSPNSCTYLKDSLHKVDGTVYVVSGASGCVGGNPHVAYPHNAMEAFNDITNGGSLILEIEGSRLDAQWLNADGAIRDRFTIIKDAGRINNIKVSLGDSVSLSASWKGDYVWSHDSSKEQNVSFYPEEDQVVVVSDQFQCIADTFKIQVEATIELITDVHAPTFEEEVKVFPNPFNEEITVSYNGPDPTRIELFNLDGTVVKNIVIARSSTPGKKTFTLNAKASEIPTGIYILKMENEHRSKIVRLNYISE